MPLYPYMDDYAQVMYDYVSSEPRSTWAIYYRLGTQAQDTSIVSRVGRRINSNPYKWPDMVYWSQEDEVWKRCNRITFDSYTRMYSLAKDSRTRANSQRAYREKLIMSGKSTPAALALLSAEIAYLDNIYFNYERILDNKTDMIKAIVP